MPLTSVATANHVRKVGESFIAVVALAAAEEDLRVFLHGDTLLPKTVDDTPTLLLCQMSKSHDNKTNVALCELGFNLKNQGR